MRRFLVFFLIQAMATAAIAQPIAPAPIGNTTTTDDGKIKLGLEGRGNYRKPKVKKSETQSTDTTQQPNAAQQPNATAPATAESTPPASGADFKQAMQSQPTSAPTPPPPPPAGREAAAAEAMKNALRSNQAFIAAQQRMQSSAASANGKTTAPMVMPNSLPQLPTSTTGTKP